MPITRLCTPGALACLDVPVLQGWGSRRRPGLQLLLLCPSAAGNRHSSVCPGKLFSHFTQILEGTTLEFWAESSQKVFQSNGIFFMLLRWAGTLCCLRWNRRALTFQNHAKWTMHGCESPALLLWGKAYQNRHRVRRQSLAGLLSTKGAQPTVSGTEASPCHVVHPGVKLFCPPGVRGSFMSLLTKAPYGKQEPQPCWAEVGDMNCLGGQGGCWGR